MTEDDDYVLKKDLRNMTLWDFYRTLPYPLPIKDELDEMNQEDQKPWLSLLVTRFENTEAFAKAQLNLPLGTIFTNSEPRKKSANDDADSHPHKRDKLFRKTMTTPTQQLAKDTSDVHNDVPHFDPVAYDKDSDVDCDNHDHEIVIPKDTGEQPVKTDAGRREGKNTIITEADNPKAI